MDVIRLRPHHLLDIVAEFKRDDDPNYQRAPGENGVRDVTRMLTRGLDFPVEFVIGPDRVCEPCSHLQSDGRCDRMQTRCDPPRSMDAYNNWLDQFLFGHLGLEPGVVMTARRFLEIANARLPVPEEAYAQSHLSGAARREALVSGMIALGLRAPAGADAAPPPTPPLPIAFVGLNFGRSVIEDVRRGPASRLVRVAGVCDLDADKAKAAASELKVPAFSSLDELLAEPDIPAVGLFTGPVGRARLIRRIIRAGKHVMTTKPFELDPEAALSVLEEARRLGRVVHLNSPGPLLTPDMAQIRRWRETHALGLPVAARADVWVSYREKANGSWYDDPRRCPVAPVLRLGIYLINDLALIFGEAKQVRVLQSRLFTQRPTSDNAQVGILYRNGALANVFASFGVKDGEPYRYSLVVNFENGTIYRHRTNAGGRLSLVTANEAGGRCVERVPLDGTTGGYQWEAFCRAVRGERLAGEIAPEQIVAGVRVIRMMAEAAG